MGTWTVPTPEIDEEQRAVLRGAARMAGDPALVPRLERIVTTYLTERRAGKPPRLDTVRSRLLKRARAIDSARRVLRENDPWVTGAIGAVHELPLAEVCGITLDLRLAAAARHHRLAAAEIPPNDHRPADRRPRTPFWDLLWAAAEMWAGAGNIVTIGVSGRFFAFASQVVAATGGTLTERPANEVARQWRRQARALTAEPEKTSLLSLVS
jgi:hypothetical protein